MINLSKLKVSLTKHGAHKLTRLIVLHDKDSILGHAYGYHSGININESQLKGILSVDKNAKVPNIWDDIRILGEQDIQDLVFIAIVFSHHSLIETMIHSNHNHCKIIKGVKIGGKSFTNFAHIIDQFNLSVEHTKDHVSYDISRIFYKTYLPGYVRKIIALKLYDAGWDGKGKDYEIAIRNNFNDVFGVTADEFRKWFEESAFPSQNSIQRVKAFRNYPTGIKFKKGHSPKYTGSSVKIGSSPQSLITFTHNRIQNELFKQLNKVHPGKVGTEVSSNNGSIDIAIKLNNQYILYEIKTAKTSKDNIRQALSQILEYAYWNTKIKVKKLIIVGPVRCDKDSQEYLKFLRDSFTIPIYYQHFDLTKKRLSKLY